MILDNFGRFLEKIDLYRDEFLFVFIKPCWPRKISPNQITYFRILIAVALIVFLFFFNIENKVLIITLFSIAVISDLLDGSVARGLNKVTDFGTILDPIADRILVLPIAVYSLFDSHKWLLLLVLLTEGIGVLLSIFHRSKDTQVKPNIFGKTKMVLWSVVFVIILVVWPSDPPIFAVDILWTSLIFSFLSIFARLLELKRGGYIKNKLINKQLNRYEA